MYFLNDKLVHANILEIAKILKTLS